MIALLVITDGRRDCIAQTIPSAMANLNGRISERWIYDDSGDENHRAWLRETFPSFTVIHHVDGRQGFGGAINYAWTVLRWHSAAPFIFHLEDDFTFNRPVPLQSMAATLDMHPELVQLALRRQPWNPAERAVGGIVEQHPDDYLEVAGGQGVWLQHRRFFTTNPSMYRRTLLERGWPTGPESEGRFGVDLFADDPNLHSAFWGRRSSGEHVHHIGRTRAGSGY